MYPNLRDPVLRLQLGKGLGHNTYGEPAWPNDLLYMFPICILAIVFLGFGRTRKIAPWEYASGRCDAHESYEEGKTIICSESTGMPVDSEGISVGCSASVQCEPSPSPWTLQPSFAVDTRGKACD